MNESAKDSTKETISFDDFSKLDLRVALIKDAVQIDGSDKLIKLTVALGSCERQIVAGIGKSYSAESLVGKKVIVLANLLPKNLMGFISEGMLLAGRDRDGLPRVLTIDDEVEPGTAIS